MFFKRVPDLSLDVKVKQITPTLTTRKPKGKRKPRYGRISMFVLGLFLLSLQPMFKEKAAEAFAKERKQQEYTLQNLINKLYYGSELSAVEQAKLCQLLWELEGVSIDNCESKSTSEMLLLLSGNDIEYKAIVGSSSTIDYKKIFFKTYPQLVGQVVVHHAIEQDVLNKFPDLFTKLEIHSLENLRGIPNDINSVLHLSIIRKAWNKFYRQNSNPTREQILEKATEIDKLYGNKFNPAIKNGN